MSVHDDERSAPLPERPEPAHEAVSPWADPTSSWSVPEPARPDGPQPAASLPAAAPQAWSPAPEGSAAPPPAWNAAAPGHVPAGYAPAAWGSGGRGDAPPPSLPLPLPSPGPYSAWPAPQPPRRGLAGLPARGAPRTHGWGLPAFLLAEAVFLLVSLAAGLFLIGGSVASPDGPQLDVGAFAVATAVPTLAAAGVAILITRLRGNGPRIDLGLVWSGRDVAIGLGLGVAGLFLSGIAAAVWIAVVGPDVSSALGDALDGLRASWPVALAVLFAVVVIAPLCEEILYRGLLWGAVEKLGAGPWLAFGITTVVFAFAHFELLRAPLLLVIALPIGLARLITGRLGASIVAHAVNNLLPGVALFLMLVGVGLPGAS